MIYSCAQQTIAWCYNTNLLWFPHRLKNLTSEFGSFLLNNISRQSIDGARLSDVSFSDVPCSMHTDWSVRHLRLFVIHCHSLQIYKGRLRLEIKPVNSSALLGDKLQSFQNVLRPAEEKVEVRWWAIMFCLLAIDPS